MLNFLIVIFAVSLIYISVAERFRAYAKLIAAQGILLMGIALFELKEVNTANLIFIVAETLIFKTIVVPFFLFRVINRTGVYKVHKNAMPSFYLVLFSIAALILSVLLANAMVNSYINTIFMVIALFALFTGLLIVVTHKLILSHLIGFLIIENSVFLFSLAVGSKMPLMIDVGILLDIFVGVLILGFFGLRLKPNTNELTMLKD
ncbi:MAG: hypothetical protein KBB11_02270 [Bacteroidales bacterium]|nr:hypothetical protein [Bacteroidales bacterium]